MLKVKVKVYSLFNSAEKKIYIMNFLNTKIPKEFLSLLSKGVNSKLVTSKLPIVDMMCAIESTCKIFCSTSKANKYRFECLGVIRKCKKNENGNISNAIADGK